MQVLLLLLVSLPFLALSLLSSSAPDKIMKEYPIKHSAEEKSRYLAHMRGYERRPQLLQPAEEREWRREKTCGRHDCMFWQHRAHE